MTPRRLAGATLPARPATGSPFVVELLGELRAERYHPGAWARFLARSARRSWDDACAVPALVRSFWRQSAALGALATLALCQPGAHGQARSRARRAAHVAAMLAMQQAYVALHLGMAQFDASAPRYDRLGAANFLSLLRGLCATLLLTADPADAATAAVLVGFGGATDVLDGAVARRSATPSRLGATLDPLADLAFYPAATLAAIRRRALPRPFGALILVRFLAPTAAGLYRYFGHATPLAARHTAAGKLAGALLVATVLLAAVRPRWAPALQVPTAVALALAGGVQTWRALSESGAPGAAS